MAARIPGTFAEISDKRSSTPSTDRRRVMAIGIKLPGGTLAVNTEKDVFSEADAIEYAGEGSQLVQMVRAVRAQDPRAKLTIVAMDAPVSAAAVGTFTFAGTATTANPAILRIEGRRVTVPVAIGDDGTAVALAADTVLTGAEFDSQHTASTQALAELTLTAKSHGVHGNEILLEALTLPPGITVTIVQPTGGAGAPDLDSALQAIGPTRYNYTILGDTDATNLADFDTYADELWTKEIQRDTHGITFKRADVSTLSTFGLGLDNKHLTTFGSPDMPNNPWYIAGVIAAARFSQSNPKASLHGDDLKLVAPSTDKRLKTTDIETILQAGVSAFHYVQDVPRVLRFLTLQKTNDLAQPTEAFLDAETKFTASEIRQSQILILDPEIGKILVDDMSSVQWTVGTTVQIVDVRRIRQILISQYSGNADSFEAQAWVGNVAGFVEALEVSKVNSTTVAIVSVPYINGIAYRFEATINVELNEG
jgi:phage tail sheath gpL-like